MRFYIADEWKHDFYKELISMKARFVNGDEIHEDAIGSMMGVGRDGTVGFISNMVWFHSFSSHVNNYVKVDYEKYRSGAEDYLITKPNVQPVYIIKE